MLHSKSLSFEDALGRCRNYRSCGKFSTSIRPFDIRDLKAVKVSAITQSGLVIAAVSQGLGKSDEILEHGVSDAAEEVSKRKHSERYIRCISLTDFVQMLYTSDLHYITATFSARTAVLCLIHTLSPEDWHTLFTKYCIALSMIMPVTAVFMITFGCDAKAPWSQVVNECESIVSLFW